MDGYPSRLVLIIQVPFSHEATREASVIQSWTWRQLLSHFRAKGRWGNYHVHVLLNTYFDGLTKGLATRIYPKLCHVIHGACVHMDAIVVVMVVVVVVDKLTMAKLRA